MKQLTQTQEIRGTLDKMAPQFKSALPAHIPVERFVRVAQTAILNNSELARADRRSLLSACVRAAESGLLPDGREAALVTFKDRDGTPQAVFMPMVGGILKLVRNSGELKSISSQIVYEKDSFKYSISESGEHLSHEPQIFADRGEPVGVYAIAILKDGGVYIEVMTRAQIDSVKSVSRGKNGPWSGPFATEMWRKTAIKRLAKRLPLSTDIDIALKADDDLYDLERPAEPSEPAEPTKPNQPSRLLDMIDEPVDVTATPTEDVPI